MTATQKIILIALLAFGGICLIVGFTLMHHIGGFMRTVEEEARKEREAAELADGHPGEPAEEPEEKQTNSQE